MPAGYIANTLIATDEIPLECKRDSTGMQILAAMVKRLLACVFLIGLAESSIARDATGGRLSDFVGEWIAISEDEPRSCTVGDFAKHENDGLIQITETEARFWESSCDLRFLKSEYGSTSLATSCSGEGEKWKAIDIWSRQKLFNRDLLIVASTSKERRSINVYERCKPR